MKGSSCGHGRGQGSSECGHGKGHHHERCSCGCHGGCSCGSHHEGRGGGWRKFTSKREKREMLENYMHELEEELQAVKEKLEELS